MSSLTNIPLLHSQPFFRFRVCAVVKSPFGVYIDVHCHFKGKNGNSFDSIFQLPKSMVTRNNGHQLIIFDCGIPLNKDDAPLPQLNYDHVDMQIHLTAGPLLSHIRGWGIRLLEDCSWPEYELLDYEITFQRNENALPLRHAPERGEIADENRASYFTHLTTGTSLTNIPLPHTSLSQPFFRFKALVEFDCKSFSYFNIQVSFRFRDSFGNHFDSPYRPYRHFESENGIHYDIFECIFPLNEGSASLAQLNYDHVAIKFELTNTREDSTARLMGCGILFFEDNTGSDGSHETRNSEEYEDSETDQFEDSGDSDIGSENDQFEECETVIWQ